MGNPEEGRVALTREQLEVFRVLYPIFKDEVYRRREQMMQLTAFTSALLLVILVALFGISTWTETKIRTPWFVISGVLLFSSLVAYLIRQHSNRHHMAKQKVIELEKNLALYEQGWQATGEALYPNNWQSDWAKDRSVNLYFSILAVLTLLVILTMFVWM